MERTKLIPSKMLKLKNRTGENKEGKTKSEKKKRAFSRFKLRARKHKKAHAMSCKKHYVPELQESENDSLCREVIHCLVRVLLVRIIGWAFHPLEN